MMETSIAQAQLRKHRDDMHDLKLAEEVMLEFRMNKYSMVYINILILN